MRRRRKQEPLPRVLPEENNWAEKTLIGGRKVSLPEAARLSWGSGRPPGFLGIWTAQEATLPPEQDPSWGGIWVRRIHSSSGRI